MFEEVLLIGVEIRVGIDGLMVVGGEDKIEEEVISASLCDRLTSF
jgi:hypothetical protein